MKKIQVTLQSITVTWIISFIIYIALMLSIFSCKTKHKVIEREKEVIEAKKDETLTEVKNNDIKIDSFSKKGSKLIIASDFKSIELTQADSSKTITVQGNNGFKLTIKGANAIIKEGKSNEIRQDSTIAKLSKTDASKINKSNTIKTKDSSKIVKRKADSDVKTTSTWLWILIIIIVAILLFVYRNRFINLFKRIRN